MSLQSLADQVEPLGFRIEADQLRIGSQPVPVLLRLLPMLRGALLFAEATGSPAQRQLSRAITLAKSEYESHLPHR